MKRKNKTTETIVDSLYYSPRELIQNKEFRSQIGALKIGGVTDGGAYSYVLTAIRRGLLRASNIGLGRIAYYKVKGSDARQFLTDRLKLK
jgi:hypothetical protein